MTQITSTIKPKRKYFDVEVTDENVCVAVRMPEDFISFGDNINRFIYRNSCGDLVARETSDDDFVYLSDNEVMFLRKGRFQISYNAIWFDFYMTDSDYDLDIPNDILDCLPSYIASQCMKIDDDYKSSVYRNEYEIFLSRIDDTHFTENKTFKIEGDW
jgi:hypothetical protein